MYPLAARRASPAPTLKSMPQWAKKISSPCCAISTVFVGTGVDSGAGVAIGDGRGQIKAAFPKAKFDESVKDTFGITLVRIPKDGGGRLQMALDAKTDKVTEFGVPYIRFCE